ncbi:hypothetical protein TRICHSKD4_2526 [Roseibium sp. TrichSKD4]|uniref:hypothetical protein n=1 Tax=Roseibium sp. TrichSKD4 TaxID=744980 RepID=UPI0001E56CCC|nr:hypothetical protein [Roseibium sp. TrichSKD4]EFO32119.1 hypothetical protein TRICHSKD4_2526 [Roseibium sp. TrichSKD4]
MRIEVRKDLKHLMTFQQRARFLLDGKWRGEAQRGVVDAGRRTKTQVQKAVAKQMNVAAGSYQGYVVANTFGFSKPQDLSFQISARKKGGKIENYKGLKVLSTQGRTAKRYNKGRSLFEKGFVKSSVWNSPRTFKRSFSRDGAFYALIPGGKASGKLPKEFWTPGSANQPRDSQGRFKSTGKEGYSIRRLYGPSLSKELDKDLSLKTFLDVAPVQLDIHVTKRVEKILKF